MKQEPHLSEHPRARARPESAVVDTRNSHDLCFEFTQQHNQQHNQQYAQQHAQLNQLDPPPYYPITMDAPIELAAQPLVRLAQPSVRPADGITFQLAFHPGWVTKLLCALIIIGGIGGVVVYFFTHRY